MLVYLAEVCVDYGYDCVDIFQTLEAAQACVEAIAASKRGVDWLPVTLTTIRATEKKTLAHVGRIRAFRLPVVTGLEGKSTQELIDELLGRFMFTNGLEFVRRRDLDAVVARIRAFKGQPRAKAKRK
jgi:hypothetical protein